MLTATPTGKMMMSKMLCRGSHNPLLSCKGTGHNTAQRTNAKGHLMGLSLRKPGEDIYDCLYADQREHTCRSPASASGVWLQACSSVLQPCEEDVGLRHVFSLISIQAALHRACAASTVVEQRAVCFLHFCAGCMRLHQVHLQAAVNTQLFVTIRTLASQQG